jgi:hypothetical protein
MRITPCEKGIRRRQRDMGLVPSEAGWESTGVWLRSERLLNSQPSLHPPRLIQMRPRRGVRGRAIGSVTRAFSERIRVAGEVSLR